MIINSLPWISIVFNFYLQFSHYHQILHFITNRLSLFQLEKRYYDGISSTKIFGISKSLNPVPGKQTDIQPWMRKTVSSWLLEVCEELHMETEVYFVAVNMMDRMTMKLFFKREHFQLLAAASLLIASKLKETLPIQPDKVIIYTDNSISFEDLIVSIKFREKGEKTEMTEMT